MFDQKMASITAIFLLVFLSCGLGRNWNIPTSETSETPDQKATHNISVEPLQQFTVRPTQHSVEILNSSTQNYHSKQPGAFQTKTVQDFLRFPRKEDSEQFWIDHPEFKGFADLPANLTNYPKWLIKLMSPKKMIKPLNERHDQDQTSPFPQNDQFVDADQQQERTINFPVENGQAMNGHQQEPLTNDFPVEDGQAMGGHGQEPPRQLHARGQWLNPGDTRNDLPMVLFPTQRIQTKFVPTMEIFPMNPAIAQARNFFWPPPATDEQLQNIQIQRHPQVFDQPMFYRKYQPNQYYPGLENNKGFQSFQPQMVFQDIDHRSNTLQRNTPRILARNDFLFSENPNLRNKLVVFPVEVLSERDAIMPPQRKKREARDNHVEFDDNKSKYFYPRNRWSEREDPFGFNNFQFENRWLPYVSHRNLGRKQRLPVVMVNLDRNSAPIDNNGNTKPPEAMEPSEINRQNEAEKAGRRGSEKSNFLFVGEGPWMPDQGPRNNIQAQNRLNINNEPQRFGGNIYSEMFPNSQNRNNEDNWRNSFPEKLGENLNNGHLSNKDSTTNIAPGGIQETNHDDGHGKMLAATPPYPIFNGSLKKSERTGDRQFQSLLPVFPNYILKKFSQKKATPPDYKKGIDVLLRGAQGGDANGCHYNCTLAANPVARHNHVLSDPLKETVTHGDKNNQAARTNPLPVKDFLPTSPKFLKNPKKLQLTRRKRDLSEFDLSLPIHHVSPLTAAVAENVNAVSHHMEFHSNNFLNGHDNFNLFGKTFSFHGDNMKQHLGKDMAGMENQRRWFESFSYPDWGKSIRDELLEGSQNHWNMVGLGNPRLDHWPSKYSIPVAAVPRANPEQVSYTTRYRYRFGIYPGYTDYKPNIDNHKVYFKYDPHQQTAPDAFLPFRS